MIVRAQVDVDVKRKAVGQVVVVQGDGPAAEEVFHRRPHQLEGPNGIKTRGLGKFFAFRGTTMPVVGRGVPNVLSSDHWIVHFNQHLRILRVDHAHQVAQTPHVLLASRGNAMSVFGVPALAVVHGAVEHEVGGAVAGQHFKAPCRLFDVLM